MDTKKIGGAVFMAIHICLYVPLLCFIFHRLWQAKSCFTLKKRGSKLLYFYTALLIFETATAMPLWVSTVMFPKLSNNPWFIMTFATIYCATIPTAGWLETCRIWLMFYDLQVSRSTTRQQWSSLISQKWQGTSDDSSNAFSDSLVTMESTPFTATPTGSIFSLSPGGSFAVTPMASPHKNNAKDTTTIHDNNNNNNNTKSNDDGDESQPTVPVRSLSALFGSSLSTPTVTTTKHNNHSALPADLSKMHASSVPEFEHKDSNQVDENNTTIAVGAGQSSSLNENRTSSSRALVMTTPTLGSGQGSRSLTSTANGSEAKLLDVKRKRSAKDRDECDNWFINNINTMGNRRYCVKQFMIWCSLPNSVILWTMYLLMTVSVDGFDKGTVWVVDVAFTALRTLVLLFVYLNTSPIDDFTFMRDEIKWLMIIVVVFFILMFVTGMFVRPIAGEATTLLIYYTMVDLCIFSRVYISCVWIIEKLRVKNLLNHKLYCGMRDGHMSASSGSSTYNAQDFPESMIPYLLRDQQSSKSSNDISNNNSRNSSRWSIRGPWSKQLTLTLTSDVSTKSDNTARSSTVPTSSSASASAANGGACKMPSQRIRTKAARAKHDLNEMLAVAKKMRPETLLLEMLRDDHGFEIFIAHLQEEFSSECLLGLVEFVQFKRSLVSRMKGLMKDRATHCAEAVPFSLKSKGGDDLAAEEHDHHHHHRKHHHKHSDDSSNSNSNTSNEEQRQKIIVTIQKAGAATKSDCPSRMTRIQLANMKFPKSVPRSYIVYSMLDSPLHACRALYEKYMGDGSNLEINVSFVCRLKVRHTIDELIFHFNADDFEHCHTLFHIWDSSINELIRLMGFSISRFLDSEAFAKWFAKSGLAKTYAVSDSAKKMDIEKQKQKELLKQESIVAAQEILSAVL